MDAIASLSTQGWELLAQLAQSSQQPDTAPDMATLLRRIAALLERSLPSPWGLIAVTEAGEHETAAWGLREDEQQQILVRNGGHSRRRAARYPLSGEQNGFLLLAQHSARSASVDTTLGNALALQIGLLVDLQRQRATKRLSHAVQQLAHAAGTQTSLEELLDLTLDQLAAVLPYTRASVLLLEEEQTRPDAPLRLAASRSEELAAPVHPAPGAPLYQNVLTIRAPQLVSAPSSDGKTRQMLLVPLLSDDLLGVLVVTAPVGVRYGRAAREAALALAEQTARSLAALRRSIQEQQRARELYVLYENSQVFSASGPLGAMLDRVLENIALALGGDRCVVALLDLENAQTLNVAAAYGFDDASDPSRKQYDLEQEPGLRSLLAQETPRAIEDVKTRRESGLEFHDQALEVMYTLGFRSGLVLPLRTKERSLGLLSVGYLVSRHSFTRSELNLGTTLANQLSTAVVNAQFAAAEQRRAAELELLQQTSQQLSADLSIEETLQAIASGVHKLVPHAALEITLYHAPDQLFEAFRSVSAEPLKHFRSYRDDEGLTGWLARHRRVLRLSDAQRSAPVPLAIDALQDGQPLRGYLGLPLQVGDELVGTVELMSVRPADFSADDERLLTILAGQSARAIHNAQRYEQADEHLRARVQQLSALQRVSSQFTIMLPQVDILAFVLEQARKATSASQGYILFENTRLPAAWDHHLLPGYAIIAADGYPEAVRAALLKHPLDPGARTVQRALALSEPEVSDNLDAEEQAAICCQAHSALAVPIFYEAEVVGVIALFSARPRGFDHDALTFVRALADQSALAIGNAQRYEDQVRLNELLQRRASMLNNVLEIGAALRADRPMEEILEQVGYSIIETTGYRRVLFNLLDRNDHNKLHAIAGAGIPLSELDRLRKADFPVELALRFLDPRFRVGRSFFIPAEQISEAEAGFDAEAITSHPTLDERAPHEWQLHDELLVPMYATDGSGLLGLLSVDDPADRQRPTARTVEPLEVFAEQAAIAIENVYLIRAARDQAEQMTALYQVGAAASSTLNLEALLERIFAQIVAYLGMPTFCYVAAYDAARDELTFLLERHAGEPLGQQRTAPRQGLTSMVIDGDQTLLIRDLDAEGALLPVRGVRVPDTTATRSWVGVPLRSQNRVVGVLSVQHSEPGRYSERDVSFLAALGNTLGMALENVDLFQERERRIAELDVINRIGTITSATLNLQQMLGQVYDCLADFLTLDSFYAMVYRADRGEIVLSFTVDEGEQHVRDDLTQPETGSLSERIIQTRQPLLFRNLAMEETGDLQPVSFGHTERESASWLGVPLLVGEGEVVGVISVQSYTAGLYAERERSFLSTVASQIALGVQNARLFVDRDQRIAELDVINRIGTIVNATLNLQQMLSQVYACLAGFLPLDSCYIYIYDEERNEISLRFEVDEGQSTTLIDSWWPAAGSMTERIIKSRQSLLFRDLRQERVQRKLNAVPIGNAAKRSASWLGVPLLVGEGKVVGVLSVQSYTPGLYGERERAFLTTVANQLAVGVQNTLLFNDRERQIAELDALGRVGRVTSSALELRPITEGLYPVLRQVIGASGVCLAVYDAPHDQVSVVSIDQEGVVVYEQPRVNYDTERTLAGITVQRNQLIVLDDVGRTLVDQPTLQLPFDGRVHRIRAYMAAPLLAFEGAPTGALIAGSIRPGAFGEREQSFFANVAAQVSLGVQNAALYAQAQEQVQQLALLNRISTTASSTMAIEEIYRAVIEALARSVEVEYVSLAIYDRTAGIARILTQQNGETGEFNGPVPLASSTALNWLDAHQRPLVSPDAQHDPRLASYHETLRQQDIRSLMLVPLVLGREVIGAAMLSTAGHSFNFAEQKVELCQTIANQTATAIENVRLFQETQANTFAIQRKVEELSTLLDAARILSSSLRPDEVLGRLMDLVGRQLGVSTVALWTIGGNNIMSPAAMEGIPPEVARALKVPVGQGMTGQVAATSQPLIVVDVDEGGQSLYPDFNRRHRLTSFMGVPVIYRERTVGVLSVMTMERREFSDDEMLLLVGLADQAAIALENARLFEQRERRIGELTTINHISASLNATLQQDDLLRALHDGIGEVIDASSSFIGLYDALSQRITFPSVRVRGQEHSDDSVLILDDPTSLLARVVLEMRPLLLNNIEEIATLAPQAASDTLLASYLGVPIVQGGDVLGVIVVQSDESFAFDADDERFLTTVASQVATAIARAQLFSERERRLSEVTALKDIGSALASTLDLQQILEHLYRELGRVVDMSTALIGLWDAEREELSYPVVYDQGQRVFFAPGPLGTGPTSWAIRNHAPLLIETLQLGEQMGLDLRDNSTRQGPPDHFEESYLVVPISLGDRMLGVISVQSYRQYAFNADDLRFVTTAANQAAVAITNAKLFTERGRRIEELATFNEIGQALSATVSLEELPELIYRQTSRLLDTTNFYMALLDERHNEVFFPLYIEHGKRTDVAPLRDGTSLTEYVVRTREPLLLQSNQWREQVARIGALPEGDLSRSWLGVPMINADRVVGVIGIQDYERENAYSTDDVRLLETIASWAGIAIANARLIQAELNRRILADTLRDVAQLFTSTLALDEIQTLILDQLARVVPYDSAAVLLRDEDALQVTAARGYGENAVGRAIEIMASQQLSAMAESRQPVLVTMVDRQAPALGVPTQVMIEGQKRRLCSWIGAPLLVADELVGVLVVSSTTPDVYTSDEMQIAFALASQASQAIQNARYVEQLADIATDLERRVADRTVDLETEKARLETVHAITLELSSSLNTEEILSKALERVCNTVGASRGSVMLKDNQTGDLVCRAVMYEPGNVHIVNLPISFGDGDGLVGWVMQYREPARIPDVRRDRRWVVEPGRAEEVRSLAAVPLIANDEPLGVLSISSPKLNYFTEPQVKLLATIANQIAIAVYNAQLYGVISDFAERIGEALEREREESSKTRAILQSATEGVIVFDDDEHIVLFNPAAEQVLGIPAAAVRDKLLNELADNGSTPAERKRAGLIYSGLRTGLDEAGMRQGIYSLPLELPDPKQTITVNLARVVGNDGRSYGNVVVLRDITREIESERTKREFVSKVSHELRTPLTPIKGYVDLLISGVLGQLNEAQTSSLTVVKTNANRLAELINDFLDISKIEAQGQIDLNMTQVQVGAVIGDVVQSMRLEVERKQMHVVVNVAEGLPEVNADKKRLTQVVLNLFSNAVKYTYNGGSIAVRAFLNPAGLLQVEVEDTGVGMSPEQQEKLFLPFYRADNPLRDEVGGTGLGLSIAKSLVEQHGGEMWVTSELGKGSIFHFVLLVQQNTNISSDRNAE